MGIRGFGLVVVHVQMGRRERAMGKGKGRRREDYWRRKGLFLMERGRQGEFVLGGLWSLGGRVNK